MDQTDSKKMSKIIQEATRQIVDQTEQFIESVGEQSLGDDTIKVMLNGSEVELNKSDYESLKAKNKEIHNQMKAEIKTLVQNIKNTQDVPAVEEQIIE